ncbi:hypothetical protein [Kitasatospora sp. CB01950]|uniref:hypothetical protein n=1 Tax=Kitasatospora sp. CB01950 TaxID=1703930 RepID=UPI00093DFA96|nr:hypothetical protein [Kitasatospora sp. CB01950]OKJ11748.1 hypothetical protein AMK19_12885 [Kitasatospora sp. CB01950]
MSARAVSGPYRIWVTLLCVALPVLTLGLLGMVPSAVLAVGRRRPSDIVAAVVIGLMQLGMFVTFGLAPEGGAVGTWAALLVIPLWIGAPVHFLVMNQRRFWPEAAPQPYGYPGYGAYQGYPAAAPTYPVAPHAAYPAPPVGGQPGAGQPGAVPPGAATGTAELRELGELLRRQAGDGQP